MPEIAANDTEAQSRGRHQRIGFWDQLLKLETWASREEAETGSSRIFGIKTVSGAAGRRAGRLLLPAPEGLSSEAPQGGNLPPGWIQP